MNTTTNSALNVKEIMTSIQDGTVFAELEYPAKTKYVSYNDDRVAAVITTEDNNVVIMAKEGMFINEVAVKEDEHERILHVLNCAGYHLNDDGTLSDVNNLITFGGNGSDINILSIGERSMEHNKTTNLITVKGYECTNTYKLTENLTRRELWTKLTSWIEDIKPATCVTK